MSEKARHAFGQSAGVSTALDNGLIDAYDILFLDGDTQPKIGWIDKNGVFRLVDNKTQVVRINALPTDSGDPDVVYIYNNECYVWDEEHSQCVSMSKSADLTELEVQVSSLETQLANKVDEAAVKTMVETAVEEAASIEVVEF